MEDSPESGRSFLELAAGGWGCWIFVAPGFGTNTLYHLLKTNTRSKACTRRKLVFHEARNGENAERFLERQTPNPLKPLTEELCFPLHLP